MNQEPGIDSFGLQLLEHVELLYSVALHMTHKPLDAERLTRITLLQAWNRKDALEGKKCQRESLGHRGLKGELLRLLRQAFLNQRRAAALRDALRTFQVPPAVFPKKGKTALRPMSDRTRMIGVA